MFIEQVPDWICFCPKLLIQELKILFKFSSVPIHNFMLQSVANWSCFVRQSWLLKLLDLLLCLSPNVEQISVSLERKPQKKTQKYHFFLLLNQNRDSCHRRVEQIQAKIIHWQEMKPVSIFLSQQIFFMLLECWLSVGTYMLKYLSERRSHQWTKTSQTTFIGVDWRFFGATLSVQRREIKETTTAAAFTWRHFYWKVILNECYIYISLSVFDCYVGNRS